MDDPLNKLRCRQLDGLRTAVVGCIRAASGQETRTVSFIKSLFKHVIKFQDGAPTQKLPDELVDSLELGLQSLEKLSKLEASPDLLNILYHVFSRALSEEKTSVALRASRLILSLLQSVDPKDSKLQVIIANAYVQLWNTSLKLCQDNFLLHQSTSYELQVQALQFLCYKGDMQAVADKTFYVASWCISRHKQLSKLNALYDMVLPQVRALLLRRAKFIRSDVLPLVSLLLEQKRACAKAGGEVSLQGQWKKVADASLFAEERYLYEHILMLSGVIDQVYALHQNALKESKGAAVKVARTINWDSCKLQTAEFQCLTMVVTVLGVKLTEIQSIVDASECKQNFLPVMLAVVEFGPLLKAHVINLHYIGAEALHFDVALKALRSVLTHYMHIIQEMKDTKKLLKLLNKAGDYFPDSLLEIVESRVEHLDETGNLGSIFYFLAYSCFQHKLNRFIIIFGRISIDLILLQLRHGAHKDKAELQKSFWKKCELLIWAYRQEDQFIEALHTIAKAFTAAPDMSTTVIGRWVKTKRDITHPNLIKSFACRTLLRHVEHHNPKAMTTEEMFHLLFMELNISIKEGLSSDSCFKVFLEMQELAAKHPMKLLSCCVDVEKAHLLWCYPNFERSLNVTFEDSCAKAVTAARMLTECGSPKKSGIAKLLLATAHFWSFLSKLDSLRNMAEKELAEAAVDLTVIKCEDPVLNQALAEEKDYSCDVIGYWHVSLESELDVQQALDEALGLWSSIVQDALHWPQLQKDLMRFWFLDHIKVAAEAYASSMRVLEEVKALMLWYVAANVLNLTQEQVLAAANLASALTKLGLVAAATEVIQQNTDGASALDDGLPKLHFLLARAQVLYCKEQFTEGLELVNCLLNHPVLQKKTKSCLMFLADVKLLAYRFAMLPPAFLPRPAVIQSDTPINLAQDALKLAQSVLRHIAEGKQGEPQDLHTKFMLERILLDSAATLGQLYINIGAAREAYCFLREYLHRAQRLVCSTSCARLILLITQMDLLCEKLHDVKVKLNGVELLLRTQSVGLYEHPTPVPSNESTVDCIVQPSLPSFVSHRRAASELLNRAKASDTPPVPSLCRLESVHASECTCHLCRCYHTMEIRLESNLLRCLLYFTVGDLSVTMSSLETQLAFYDLLRQKLNTDCSNVLSFLKPHFPTLPHTINCCVGAWGRLLTIHAKILLYISDVRHAYKNCSFSLDNIEEALNLFAQHRGARAYCWDILANLMHHKTKVLLAVLSRAAESEGEQRKNGVWLSNVNENAAETVLCSTPPLSPVRQYINEQASWKVASAPRARKNTMMDRYLRSLDIETKGSSKLRAFSVFDEEAGRREEANKADGGLNTRARSTTAARQRAVSRPEVRGGTVKTSTQKAIEAARSPPKKGTRARRQAAHTNLNSSNGASTVESKASQQQTRGVRTTLLNRIEEEAVTIVVKSSPADSAGCSELPYAQRVHNDALTQQEVQCKTEPMSLEEIKLLLDDALQLVIHFPPCPLYSEMCGTMVQLLAMQKRCTSQHRKVSSWYLSQTAAVTLQHLGLNCLNKKLRKQSDDSGKDLSSSSLKKVETLKFKMPTGNEAEHLMGMLCSLPQTWTVVQITAADIDTKGESGVVLTPDLLVCQYRHDSCPITIQLSGSSDAQFHRSLFKEYKSIMSESVATMKTTDPALWWNIRRSLDKRLKELTESMENVWMGSWKGVFNGKPASPAYQQLLSSAVAKVLSEAAMHNLQCCSQRLLEAVVDSVEDLSVHQLSVAICQLFGIKSSHTAHNKLIDRIKSTDMGSTDRHPVILILGKTIQALPWECVPLLRKNSVSRVPSLSYLQAQLHYYRQMTENVYIRGVDTNKTYFILNPSNDIPRTQAQFEEMFKKEGWPGVCGKPPQKEEFQSAIAGKDLILYCGHGSGREYLCGDVIEQMLCHACPVLMGCGSGRLKVFGSRIEPIGVVLQYWLGGSPCVVANLWEVTDRDIDRFTEEFLKLWIPQLVTRMHVADVTTAVQSARRACKLQHLVGAAPVVYGIPVTTMLHKPVNQPL